MDNILNNKLKLAESYLESQDFKKAILIADKLINEDDNNYKAFEVRAFAKSNLSQNDDAIDDLNKAISINNNSDKAYWLLSQIYRLKEDIEKSKFYLLKAIEINNDNLNYIADLAYRESELKNHLASIKYCSIILKEYPTDEFALGLRGYSFIELKEYDKAIIDLNKCIKENNYNVHALNNYGFALSRVGRHKESFKFFLAAIEIEPNFYFAYDNLGYAYYLDEDYSNALSYINQSIEINPNSSWAYKDRAIVNIALHNFETAKKDLNIALELGYTEEYDNEVNELIEKLGK